MHNRQWYFINKFTYLFRWSWAGGILRTLQSDWFREREVLKREILKWNLFYTGATKECIFALPLKWKFLLTKYCEVRGKHQRWNKTPNILLKRRVFTWFCYNTAAALLFFELLFFLNCCCRNWIRLTSELRFSFDIPHFLRSLIFSSRSIFLHSKKCNY